MYIDEKEALNTCLVCVGLLLKLRRLVLSVENIPQSGITQCSNLRPINLNIHTRLEYSFQIKAYHYVRMALNITWHSTYSVGLPEQALGEFAPRGLGIGCDR